MAQDKSKKIASKVVIVGLIALGIIAFRYFDLGQYLTLEYIKASQEKFHTLYLSYRFLVITAFAKAFENLMNSIGEKRDRLSGYN